jgi:hypothetical protein
MMDRLDLCFIDWFVVLPVSSCPIDPMKFAVD